MSDSLTSQHLACPAEWNIDAIFFEESYVSSSGRHLGCQLM